MQAFIRECVCVFVCVCSASWHDSVSVWASEAALRKHKRLSWEAPTSRSMYGKDNSLSCLLYVCSQLCKHASYVKHPAFSQFSYILKTRFFIACHGLQLSLDWNVSYKQVTKTWTLMRIQFCLIAVLAYKKTLLWRCIFSVKDTYFVLFLSYICLLTSVVFDVITLCSMDLKHILTVAVISVIDFVCLWSLLYKCKIFSSRSSWLANIQGNTWKINVSPKPGNVLHVLLKVRWVTLLKNVHIMRKMPLVLWFAVIKVLLGQVDIWFID